MIIIGADDSEQCTLFRVQKTEIIVQIYITSEKGFTSIVVNDVSDVPKGTAIDEEVILPKKTVKTCAVSNKHPITNVSQFMGHDSRSSHQIKPSKL